MIMINFASTYCGNKVDLLYLKCATYSTFVLAVCVLHFKAVL